MGVKGKRNIPQRDFKRYRELRENGMGQTQASRIVGFSRATACRYDQEHGFTSGRYSSVVGRHPTQAQLEIASDLFHGPIPYEKLSERAKRGWDDFEFFRLTYLGHVSTPWQVETGNTAVELLATPDKEFVVENVSPGSGKSTLIHDLSCWVTVRNRAIRGLFGSRVQGNADRALRRTRRTFERITPYRAPDWAKEAGIACDAQATLSADYGLFRPAQAEIWRGDEFIIAQFDDLPIEEKEPTWSSYGMDGAVLGNRFNIIFWDDVVDKTNIRTMEAAENQRQWWDEEGETRLEPGGLLWLVGQRMSANDLYRYNLDKKFPPDEEAVEAAGEMTEEQQQEFESQQPTMYRHIVYKAHSEDKCRGTETHKPGAPAFPEGCLLDPYRLPWRDLYRIQYSKAQTYSISYQQEDTDPANVLVKHAWVRGGTDPQDGTLHPGCIDDDRALCELPSGLKGPVYSLATVDPSPTKWWAIQWWAYAPNAGNQLFLLDLLRKKMGGNELLDWDLNNAMHYGVMEDWQQRSVDLGLPITHWVVEANAAQRFLLQYQFVSAWQRKWLVNVMPHQTTLRKLDADLGLDMVKDWWRFGRIRLPNKGQDARLASLKLIDEVTRYPKAMTDDQVLAHWFAVLHLPRIAIPVDANVTQWRPSWVSDMPDARRLVAL